MQVICFFAIKNTRPLHLLLITFISLMKLLRKKKKNLEIWGDEGEKRSEIIINVLPLQTVCHQSQKTFCNYQWLPLRVSETGFNMLYKIHYILRPFPISVAINQEIHLFKVTYGELITQKILTTSFSKIKVLYYTWHSYTERCGFKD